jgi:hypothetical protein
MQPNELFGSEGPNAVYNTVDPRVTTGVTYEQLGLRPKF